MGEDGQRSKQVKKAQGNDGVSRSFDNTPWHYRDHLCPWKAETHHEPFICVWQSAGESARQENRLARQERERCVSHMV